MLKEPLLETLTHGWPLGSDDAVNVSVARRAVRAHLEMTDDAVPARAERLDRALRALVEIVDAKADPGDSLHCVTSLESRTMNRLAHLDGAC